MAPQTPNVPPPAKGMSPQQYYSFLIQQGVPGWAAYDAVQGNFGGQNNLNKPDAGYQWGQVGGMIGGSIIGREIASGFPNIGGLFSSGGGAGAAQLTTDASIAAPKIIGAKAVEGAAAAPGTSSLGSVGSVALPLAAAALTASEAWESGGKDILRGRGDKQDWTNVGVNMLGGVIPNAVMRWMGKPSLGRKLTSGKSDDQLLRDDFRGSLKASGIADDEYNVTLADGSKFNIGKDGKATLLNADGKTERRYWNTDTSNPLANYAITKIDPIIRAKYTQEAEAAGYKPEQYTAIMVNAVTSNAKTEADVNANIDRIFNNQGNKTPSGEPAEETETKPGQYQSGQSLDTLASSMSQQMAANSNMTPQQQPIDPQYQYVQDLANRLRNQGR